MGTEGEGKIRLRPLLLLPSPEAVVKCAHWRATVYVISLFVRVITKNDRSLYSVQLQVPPFNPEHPNPPPKKKPVIPPPLQSAEWTTPAGELRSICPASLGLD